MLLWMPVALHISWTMWKGGLFRANTKYLFRYSMTVVVRGRVEEQGKGKVKAHTSLGVLLLPPGQDAPCSPSQGYPPPPSQYVASTHLYTWVKRDRVE